MSLSCNDALARPGVVPPMPLTNDNSVEPGRTCNRVLYTAEDDSWLSGQLCLLRAQIEAFAATPADVEARARQGGSKNPPAVGRVGIRCIHCKHLALDDRARGAVSYPNSIRLVHQAVRNWQRYHFPACEHIPAATKAEFGDIKRKQSKKESNDYWVESCVQLGMVDTENGDGIRFNSDGSMGRIHKQSRKGRSNEVVAVIGDASLGAKCNLSEADVAASGPNVAPLGLNRDLFARPIPVPGIAGALNVGFDSSEVMMTGRNYKSSEAKPANAVAIDLTRNTESEEKNMQHGKKTLLDSVLVAMELAKEVRERHALYSSLLSDDNIRRDLVCLGTVLYRHFSGVDPPDKESSIADSIEETVSGALVESSVAEETPLQKRGRRTDSGASIFLRDLGLPVSVCLLVSNLMDANDDKAVDRYETAKEVEEDLRLMTTDLERYLFDTDLDMQSGKLEFPEGKLYGRERHVFQLLGSFGRVVGSRSSREMVLVSGYSGTGKSALVDQVRKPLLEMNGHFISGKFDELGQVQPMSVIFSAFNEFCNDLCEGSAGTLERTRLSINEALGKYANVLMNLLPNLSKVMGASASSQSCSPPPDIGGREALNRFLLYFRAFVGAIARPSHPVVLFFDDLQWADQASLGLISLLVSDVNIDSMLFVGCYRDNEVGLDHALHAEVRSIETSGVSIQSIKLENIDQQSVNTFVSDTLHLSPRLCRSLATIVYSKTGGNPLFAVQFLRSLCDEKLLQYSASSRRWEWDMEAIQSKDIAYNVVDLMTKKMLKLDAGVQWFLKVAACLGSRSETSTLKLLGEGGGGNDGLHIFLEVAIREGLMSRVGSVYKFSHDQIQHAAYSLIPESERNALHLSIGRLLWKKASDDDLSSIMIFQIVDQLHRGSALITDHAEKVEVARLCLKAGEKAISSSSFLPASIYLLQGSVLLQESDWEHNYGLSLELFTCCAETQYVTGNYDGVMVMLNPILKHGRCLQDKLRAQYAFLNSLGAQGKQHDAIKHGLEVLAQLGERFPAEARPNTIEIEDEFSKTQGLLGETTIAEILDKPIMVDTKKIAAMKLLSVLNSYAFHVNQGIMHLMMLRMVQLSLSHGVCQEESALAFASLGFMLCSRNKYEEGHQYGKLALSLLDRFSAKKCLARVYLYVYGNITMFTEPMQAGLASLNHGYKVGMSAGDNDWALSCVSIYSVFAFQSGRKLEKLAQEVKEYSAEMKRHKSYLFTLTLPYLQAILNLVGCSENPTELTGEAMDQDELLNSAHENRHLNVVSHIYFLRMLLAFWFRRYDLAAEMAELRRAMSKSRPVRGGTIVNETFYTGLISVVMVHEDKGDGDEWRSRAHSAVDKLEGWVESSSWNFQHKLDLLKAEIAYYLDGDTDEATRAYGDAIRVAGEHGFIHEQALACERAGVFCSKALSPSIASDYFEQARRHYLEWGAIRKAKDVLDHFLDNS